MIQENIRIISSRGRCNGRAAIGDRTTARFETPNRSPMVPYDYPEIRYGRREELKGLKIGSLELAFGRVHQDLGCCMCQAVGEAW